MSRFADAFWQISAAGGGYNLCNCIGPQNGEPLCPCQMRHVKIKDGRYVQVIDHGPVKPEIELPKLVLCKCGESIFQWDKFCRHCGAAQA